MDFLEVWEHPELFEDYDFSNIDSDVDYILKVRENNSKCNEIIKELNNRIDIDFIKDSEYIEGNNLMDLEPLVFDDDFQDLEGNAEFKEIKKIRDIDDFCFGRYRTIHKNGSLIIYRKDFKTNKICKYQCKMPTHLKALRSLFAQARKESLEFRAGQNPKVTSKLIENLHETLFSSYIEINLKMDKRGNVIRPEGYGKFRRTINSNGKQYKINVEVAGTNWTPTDSDDVRDSIEKLLDNYNNSNLHPIIKAVLFKVGLIKIHPFRDGNGRTSRLMLNYMLIRSGYPTVTIRGDHKQEYFDALDTAIEKVDYSLIIEMVKQELEQRCEQYKNVISSEIKANQQGLSVTDAQDGLTL